MLHSAKTELKSGLATSSYAAALIRSALLLLSGRAAATSISKNDRATLAIEIRLPGATSHATILVDYLTRTSTLPSPPPLLHLGATKENNDDLDATRGVRLELIVADKAEAIGNHLNPTPQRPIRIDHPTATILLYAGRGIGVSTLPGLRVEVGEAAINPAPRRIIEENIKDIQFSQPLHLAILAIDGESIAEKTANPRVGIRGGLSILGSSGIVKPLSNEAWLDSLAAEISVAAAQGCEEIWYALGATSLRAAHHANDRAGCTKEKKIAILECGNFFYESLRLASRYPTLCAIRYYLGPGKMAKLSAGFQNAHNRFGEIDPLAIARLARLNASETAQITLACNKSRTIGAMRSALSEKSQRQLLEAIHKEANLVLRGWLDEITAESNQGRSHLNVRAELVEERAP